MSGCLFIVSTPIGNPGDISLRAIEVLKSVQLVAAEDTRRTGQLLSALSINQKMISLHDHNEAQRASELIETMQQGHAVALVSDAGTPLVSDPGYRLVRQAQDEGITVVPVPGASALLAALAVAGLPSDRFVFLGFPPAKAAARRAFYDSVSDETATMIFYEAPHRILSSLRDAAAVFGDQREAVLCRELTKQYETVRRGSLAVLCEWVDTDANQQRGEIVLLVRGSEQGSVDEAELIRLAALLKAELPPSRAAKVLAAWSGRKKSELYRLLGQE